MNKIEWFVLFILTLLFIFGYKHVVKIQYVFSSKALVEETIKEKVKSECLK